MPCSTPLSLGLVLLALAPAAQGLLQQKRENFEVDYTYDDAVEHVRHHSLTAQESRDFRKSIEVEAVVKECKCLNWMKVYAFRGVKCGQGLERGAGSLKTLPTVLPVDDPQVMGIKPGQAVYRDLCKNFYMRMNHSYAMNPHLVQDVPDAPDTWCYVSSKCQWLNGGAAVPGAPLTSVRFNKVGDNNTALRDLRMKDILELAQDNVLDLGTLLANGAYLRSADRWDGRNIKQEETQWVRKTYKPWMLTGKNDRDVRFLIYGNMTKRIRPGWPQSSVPLPEEGETEVIVPVPKDAKPAKQAPVVVAPSTDPTAIMEDA